MSEEKKKIWFPAKRYGWGWGIPCCWQGWMVLGVFVLLIAASCILLLKHPIVQVACQLVLALLLIAICWWKGEQPRWRWGRD